MRRLSSIVADAAESVWVALGGERRDARRAARLSLPQHPETPWCPASIDLVDLVDGLDEGLLERGLAAYHASMVAALLALSAKRSDHTCVVDAAADLGVVGMVAAAALRPAEVVALRAPAEVPALQRAANRNRLGVTVVDANRWIDVIDGLDQGRVGSTDRTVLVFGHTPATDLLRGIHRSIRQLRPAVLMPFPDGPNGLADGTRKLLRRLGYVGYRLTATPRWRPRRRWSSRASSPYPYWLLVPQPVDDEFVDRFEWWLEELAAAVPLTRTQRSPAVWVIRSLREGGFVRAASALGRAVRSAARPVGRRVIGRIRHPPAPTRPASSQSSSSSSASATSSGSSSEAIDAL